MSTQENWLVKPIYGSTSTMNGKVVMTFSQIENLHKWAWDNPWASTFFGDYTKWCSSLIFYPFHISNEGAEFKLKVNVSQSNDITCHQFKQEYEDGYYLGEYYYNEEDIFLNYEPYSKLQIWLPYYGFIDVKIADVIGKYIQFRLYVDFSSGSGQYVVGVSPNHISYSPDSIPLINNSLREKDKNTRIIGTYNFQIGYSIPITSTGSAEVIRNTTLAAIKTAAVMGASYVSASALPIAGITVETTIETQRNPKNGRVVASSKRTTTKEHRNEKTDTHTPTVSSGINSIPTIISALHANPQMDKSNNSIINSANSNSIVIVKRRVKPTISIDDELYNHVIGKPLCVVDNLIGYRGYTECENLHFENKGFDSITDIEKNMLENYFRGGVIL